MASPWLRCALLSWRGLILGFGIWVAAVVAVVVYDVIADGRALQMHMYSVMQCLFIQ